MASNAEDIQHVIGPTIAALGRINILVNNAGMAWIDHTLTTSDEQGQYCMEANLFSAVRFSRGVAPHMRKQGCGRIINISSMSVRTTRPNATDYTTAEAGTLAFSKTISFELAPDNILVNCVCPASEL